MKLNINISCRLIRSEQEFEHWMNGLPKINKRLNNPPGTPDCVRQRNYNWAPLTVCWSHQGARVPPAFLSQRYHWSFFLQKLKDKSGWCSQFWYEVYNGSDESFYKHWIFIFPDSWCFYNKLFQVAEWMNKFNLQTQTQGAAVRSPNSTELRKLIPNRISVQIIHFIHIWRIGTGTFDIFGVTRLKSWVADHVNTRFVSIRFTLNTNNEVISFLGVMVKKTGQLLHTDI